MSFPRHGEIFPSDGGASPAANAPAHRLDEFPAGYSLAGCSPAVPAAASPAVYEYAVMTSCRSRSFHRTVNCVLTVCVSQGGKRTLISALAAASKTAGLNLEEVDLTNEADIQNFDVQARMIYDNTTMTPVVEYLGRALSNNGYSATALTLSVYTQSPSSVAPNSTYDPNYPQDGGPPYTPASRFTATERR
jgi:hypothetical protein